MAQTDAPPPMTPAEAARHNPTLEGERLVNAALDKQNPHAFRDELAMLTDPKQRQEAIDAAKAYELKREKDGVTNPSLPTVQFYESNGKLGEVKVSDPTKHKTTTVYDSAGKEDQTVGDKAKGILGHIKLHN